MKSCCGALILVSYLLVSRGLGYQIPGCCAAVQIAFILLNNGPGGKRSGMPKPQSAFFG